MTPDFPLLFPLTRLCRSQTAERLGLDNVPNRAQTLALAGLAWNVLQPLQALLTRTRGYDGAMFPAGCSLALSSVFRSDFVNGVVGGSKTSQHTKGEAADFEAYGLSNTDLGRHVAATVPFDQLIFEHVSRQDPAAGWVHVSYREGANRFEVWTAAAGVKLRAGVPSWAPPGMLHLVPGTQRGTLVLAPERRAAPSRPSMLEPPLG